MNHTMPATTVQALTKLHAVDDPTWHDDTEGDPYHFGQDSEPSEDDRSPGQVAWEAYTAAAGITNGTTWQQLPGDSKARWEATAAAVLDHYQSSEVPNA